MCNGSERLPRFDGLFGLFLCTSAKRETAPPLLKSLFVNHPEIQQRKKQQPQQTFDEEKQKTGQP